MGAMYNTLQMYVRIHSILFSIFYAYTTNIQYIHTFIYIYIHIRIYVQILTCNLRWVDFHGSLVVLDGNDQYSLCEEGQDRRTTQRVILVHYFAQTFELPYNDFNTNTNTNRNILTGVTTTSTCLACRTESETCDLSETKFSIQIKVHYNKN